jgi:sugar transferase (PEP-CTERM/EpsH1 system associated)
MKILFLAHRLPYPPDKGEKIRAFNILKHLASQHEVHLVSWADGEHDLRAAHRLAEIVPHLHIELFHSLRQRLQMLRALYSGKPLTVHYFYAPALAKHVHALLHRTDFDVLYVYSSAMAEYVLDADMPVRIIDFCDLDSEKYRQFASMQKPPLSWLYRMESKRLACYEKHVAAVFHHVLFINAEEQHLFDSGRRDGKTIVLSNGVDLQRYFGSTLPSGPKTGDGNSPALVFTGTMDYLPNVDAVVWFAEKVLPKIKAIVPGTQFYILGRRPTRSIRKLHDPDKAIFVSGYVDNMRKRMKNADVFIAPMRIARGMQTKLLEAMACGVPVVTSPAATKGIGAWPNREVLVAETEAEYARQVLRLLFNPRLRNGLRNRAFSFIQHNFDWEKNLALLDKLILQHRMTCPAQKGTVQL